MLSYKQWKSLNESILPSFNLGLGNPNSLGIQTPFGFEEAKHGKKSKKKMPTGDGEIVDASSKKDDPKEDEEEEVEVDVDVEKADDKADDKAEDKAEKADDHEHSDEDEDGMCDDCGKLCGVKAKKWAKKCKLCGMKSKKKMGCGDEETEKEWSDDDDQPADKDEDKAEDKGDDEGEDKEEPKMSAKKCMKSKKKMGCGDDEGHDDEDHDEDHEEEDHDEDHDEEEKKEVDAPMMSKKKMLKGDQHKLDKDGDGKITGKDFKLMHKEKKHDKKHGKKHESSEDAWWASVQSMIGSDPAQKFSDGLFTPLDTDNLYQAVRSED